MGDDADAQYEADREQFVTDLVAGIERLGRGFVQSFVVVASTETVAGVERWFYQVAPGQGSDRSLGLLEAAAASERFVIAHTFPASGFLFDHDDDD